MAGKTTHGRKGEAVRALARGLAILRFINRTGETGPGEIARALDIPRPTVYRLLETLEELGYVTFSATSTRVRVSRLAASLGDGYLQTTALCQAAGPLFAEYGAKLIWPLDLNVYDNAAMVIQESTHGTSPLSIDRAMTGYRLPMLRTSAGRAYLAFCGDEERKLILDHLHRLGDPADTPFLEPVWLNRMIAQTRERGLAVRDAGEFRAQTASFAAPVISNGVVVGTVSMIWIKSAMSTSKAVEQSGPVLKELVVRLAATLEG